jgi:hypothetical protein
MKIMTHKNTFFKYELVKYYHIKILTKAISQNKHLTLNKSYNKAFFKPKISKFKSFSSNNKQNYENNEQSSKSEVEMFNLSDNDKELNYDIKNIEKIGNKSKKDLQPAFTITNPNDINNKYIPDAVKNYSLKIVDTSEIDEIHHDEEVKGVYYKYGLPVKNEIYKPHQAYLQELKEKEKAQALTATENIMELFDLNKDSSYESLVIKYNQTFNNGK